MNEIKDGRLDHTWSRRVDRKVSILCMESKVNGYKNGHVGSGNTRICKGRNCECPCHKSEE